MANVFEFFFIVSVSASSAHMSSSPQLRSVLGSSNPASMSARISACCLSEIAFRAAWSAGVVPTIARYSAVFWNWKRARLWLPKLIAIIAPLSADGGRFAAAFHSVSAVSITWLTHVSSRWTCANWRRFAVNC